MRPAGMHAGITARQLWFTGPEKLEVRSVQIDAPAADEVLVRTHYSAVSAGTEMLVYRGQLPEHMALDSTLASLQDSSDYPMQYGYACVGVVEQVGAAVDAAWLGRQVFAFQPHASHFCATPDTLHIIPAGIPLQAAALLPNMETAINLVQDGQPLIGEDVLVLGQGIVGLLLTCLLARFPLGSLTVVDAHNVRLALAQKFGADLIMTPGQLAESRQCADLIYEVTGRPEVLNQALNASTYCSRIVIGSWYGNKSAAVDLGGAAHRNRLQIITSQVSTIAPALSGRWTKQRRFDVAWQMLRQLDWQSLITNTVPLQHAPMLYQQLNEASGGIIQPLITYAD